MRPTIRTVLMASTFASLCNLPAPLMAQAPTSQTPGAQPSDMQASQQSSEGYDIVVTATRRAENLLNVPLSMSVLTSADIQNRGLVNGADYLRGLPGVNQLEGGPFSQGIIIRGIESSPNGQNFNSGTTTATYFGETPTTNSAGMAGNSNVDIKLVDVARVEVLRGPQGTAFGSASLGGAVRVIPVAPNLHEWEGQVAAGYSVTTGSGGDNYNLQAIVNVPLVTDILAVRAVAYRHQDSGFYRNRAASSAAFRASLVTPFGVSESLVRDENQVGEYNVWGGRVSALFQPIDNLRLNLLYLKQRAETDGVPIANSGVYEQTFLQIAPEHVRRGQTGGFYDTDLDLANVTVEYNLRHVNFTAIYSHIDSTTNSSTSFGFAGLNLPGSINASSDNNEDIAEFRVATNLNGPINLIAGLYYEDIKDSPGDDFFQTFFWTGSPATNVFGANGPRLIGTLFDRRHSTQKAIYGELSWEIVSGLTLTGGARAYDYERTRTNITSGPLQGNNNSTLSSSASGTSFRANVSYRPNADVLVWAGFSQGFRLGRPQTPFAAICDRNGDGTIDGTGLPIAATGTLTSDTVNNYEVGARARLLDGRLDVEATIFRMEWSNFPGPFTAPPPPTGCGLTTTLNAGDAVSQGVEFQTHYRLAERTTLGFGGSYTDAHLTEDVPQARLVKGNRLAGAPDWNFNLGVEHGFDIAGYPAALRADAIYVGTYYGNLAQLPLTRAGDYFKVDASFRISFGDLDVNLYVQNLTDENAFISHSATPATSFFKGSRMRPLTAGVGVRYVF